MISDVLCKFYFNFVNESFDSLFFIIFSHEKRRKYYSIASYITNFNQQIISPLPLKFK